MIHVVCGILIADQRVLVARRTRGRHAGLWEFPGGKIDGDETAEMALARELAEELGIGTVVGAWIATGRDAHVELKAYRVNSWTGEMVASVHDALAWVDAARLSGLVMPPVDRQLLPCIASQLSDT